MNTSRRPFKLAAWVLVLIAFVGLIVPVAVSAQNYHMKELVIERCSTTVHIVPRYTEEPGNINPPGAIVLHRNSNGWSDWSAPMVLIYHPDGQIRWYCGTTAESSGCPEETVAIKAQLGTFRLLRIQCLTLTNS